MKRCCSSYQRLGNSTTLHWERIVSSPRSRCASSFLVLPRDKSFPRTIVAPNFSGAHIWSSFPISVLPFQIMPLVPFQSHFLPLAILGGAALGSDGEQGEEGRYTEEDCFFSKRSNHGAATTCCCVAPNYHGAATTTSCRAPTTATTIYSMVSEFPCGGIHGGQATSANPWYIASTNL
jgi:hypothetical protein